jgi:hypothetical protein
MNQTVTHRQRFGSLHKLSVSQFISFGFYTMPFAVFAIAYDISKGIGWVSAPKPMSTALHRIWYVGIIWGLIFANAVRLYLSNWAVEEHQFFTDLKRAANGAPWTIAEWWLRFASLICIYLIPLSLATQNGKWIEVLLVGSFLFLFLWDRMVAKEIAKSSTLPGLLEVLQHGFKHQRLDNFPHRVVFWRFFEGVGLLFSALYIGAGLLSFSPDAFTYILAVINSYFVLLFLTEFYVNLKGGYPPLLGWSACLGIVLYVLRHILVS